MNELVVGQVIPALGQGAHQGLRLGRTRSDEDPLSSLDPGKSLVRGHQLGAVVRCELTLDAQVKLLRVLQEKEFERLGGSRTISVDVRVIAASNGNLEKAVRERRFREDVWFRLNVFPIHIPPLRQRKEDIPALVQWLIARKCREMGLPEQPDVAPDAMEQLRAYDWPGNVRELQNIIERALILCRGGALVFPHLGTAASGTAVADPGESPEAFPPLDRMVSEHIRRALSLAGGRVQGDGGAAQLLGVNPSTLRARMRKLGVLFGGRVAQ